MRQKLQKTREELIGDAAKPDSERKEGKGEGEGEPMLPPPATRAGG